MHRQDRGFTAETDITVENAAKALEPTSHKVGVKGTGNGTREWSQGTASLRLGCPPHYLPYNNQQKIMIFSAE